MESNKKMKQKLILNTHNHNNRNHNHNNHNINHKKAKPHHQINLNNNKIKTVTITKQPKEYSYSIFVKNRNLPIGHWMGNNAMMQLRDKSEPILSDLEYLTNLDHLFVTKHTKSDKYEMAVKNSENQLIYAIRNDVNWCEKVFCCCEHFNLRLVDRREREVLCMKRTPKFKCFPGCFIFPFCLEEMTVKSSTTKRILGFVVQRYSFIVPEFVIENDKREQLLYIKGPACRSPFCTINFSINNKRGNIIGKISNEHSEFESGPKDLDVFGVSFPVSLDVRIKVLLLAATILIDTMFFEFV